jgi:uncharacterized protein
MTKALVVTALLLSTLIPAIGHAASFDCKKAKTHTERTICANADVSKLDSEMAVKYKVALAQSSHEEAVILKARQKKWLTYRDKVCKNKEDCLTQLYKEQITTLTQWKLCVDISRVLDIPAVRRPNTFMNLKSSPSVGGETKYFGIDIDQDGSEDTVVQGCGSQDMPCNLFITLSTGGDMELEEERFYLARFRGQLIAVVGDSASSGRKASEPRDRSIYQIRKSGIELVCLHV